MSIFGHLKIKIASRHQKLRLIKAANDENQPDQEGIPGGGSTAESLKVRIQTLQGELEELRKNPIEYGEFYTNYGQDHEEWLEEAKKQYSLQLGRELALNLADKLKQKGLDAEFVAPRKRFILSEPENPKLQINLDGNPVLVEFVIYVQFNSILIYVKDELSNYLKMEEIEGNPEDFATIEPSLSFIEKALLDIQGARSSAI